MREQDATGMDLERSSLCNCVVNFLLEENYFLTAFELLHELLEDGRDAHAIRLKDFFSDPFQFPPDQISRFNSLKVADPQTLFEENGILQEKLAIREYELRLAHEDVSKLKAESGGVSLNHMADIKWRKKDATHSTLGPLKENERKDLSCAVKEYLLLAGYHLTAMTFYEEASDQNLDSWPNSPASVPDALRHYYYQYLSSTENAAEEKLVMLKEIESLSKATEILNHDKELLLKNKELNEVQISALNKSIDSLRKNLMDKETQVRKLKSLVDTQRLELNECRSDITSLQTQVEGSLSRKNSLSDESDPHCSDNKEQGSIGYISHCSSKNVEVLQEEEAILANPDDEVSQTYIKDFIAASSEILNNGSSAEKDIDVCILREKNSSSASLKTGLETIQIISDTLPKIVPYVLIKNREELLPLIMCAIELHPDSNTRDSLTHTLFNLIKRPDEKQRRVIMDACVSLAKSVGEMRTETELLPQCWEQINHMYEERRLLVAQSCGELAKFVHPEIRDSLILSIIQQLIEDPATVVRESAAHNLALLLPLFPNKEKYFKVEELMFQLVFDPAGIVVDTTLKELVPSLIKWGNKLDHILLVLLSHMLNLVQHCPTLSGVEGSIESHLRVLGERERWNIDVLLQMLIELVPYMYQKAVETCPFLHDSESEGTLFCTSILELYAKGHVEWSAFEWLHMECFPGLIQIASSLSQKEDSLRNRITKFLLTVSQQYGDFYLTNITLPIFMISIGDDADLNFFPSSAHLKIKGLKPKDAVSEKLATLSVMPLLLAGVLGAPSKHEQLKRYLRKILIQSTTEEFIRHNGDIVDAIRFLCTFKVNHNLVFNILWEMVVSSSVNMKICAANLLKVMVPYIDAKMLSTNVLPAFITLGSDQNLNVKYASIDAFGAVAQHFKNDLIAEKIRVQMETFLEDGSHEATIAVSNSPGPLYLHPSNSPGTILVSKSFNGKGFPTCKRAMMIALSAKNKISFIDGSFPRSSQADDPFKLRLWDRCNDLVISWILNSLDKSIDDNVLFTTTAQEIWNELESRFSRSLGAQIFTLQKEISILAQGVDDVTTYFTRLKKRWDELSALRGIPVCSCGSAQAMSKHEQRLFHFLIGLMNHILWIESIF